MRAWPRVRLLAARCQRELPLRPPRRNGVEESGQGLEVEGFCQEFVEPRLARRPLVLAAGIGREGHQSKRSATMLGLAGAQAPRRFQTVDPRHADVDESEIEPGCGMIEPGQRLGPVPRQNDRGAETLPAPSWPGVH